MCSTIYSQQELRWYKLSRAKVFINSNLSYMHPQTDIYTLNLKITSLPIQVYCE